MNKFSTLIYLLLGLTLFCNSQSVNKTGPIYLYKHKRIDRLDLYKPSKYPEILENYKDQLKLIPAEPDSLNLRMVFYRNKSVEWIGYINSKGIYYGPGLFIKKNGDRDRMFTSFNGVLNGDCIYYKQNKIKIAGNFKNGKPHGEWTYYSKEGKIKKIRTYPDK